MRFKDRIDAGRQLAGVLRGSGITDAVVYALPRGGVVLGAVIANALGAPLDLVITRKIGHPSFPEYAIGAVAEDGRLVFDEAELESVDPLWLQERVKAELQEARRRRERYLAGRAPRDADGKVAIITDDGVATGLTLRAAIKEVKRRRPRRIIVAVPVIPKEVAEIIREEVDELISLHTPAFYLGAVGAYYNDFTPVEDDEVVRLLDRAQPVVSEVSPRV